MEVVSDRLVECVTLYRISPSLLDEVFDLTAGHGLGGVSPGHVRNLFFQHSPVQIVRTKGQGDLRNLGPSITQ